MTIDIEDRRLEALIRLDEALRAGERIYARGENAAYFGRLHALVKHGLGELTVGGLHTARIHPKRTGEDVIEDEPLNDVGASPSVAAPITETARQCLFCTVDPIWLVNYYADDPTRAVASCAAHLASVVDQVRANCGDITSRHVSAKRISEAP